MSKKIEFETYRDLTGSWTISGLEKKEPGYINFLSYKKYKVTIELVTESNETYIERLESMLSEGMGYNNRSRINSEIERLKKLRQ